MSRVGKKPIVLPEGVKVNILREKIEFEGKKGKLTSPLYEGISARVENNSLLLTRSDDSREQKALHGLCRSLANNAVIGLTSGFSKQLEIFGVGYRAKLEKDRIELSLGYSRPIIYEIPKGIEVVMEKPTLITVKGIDKQRVGQVAEEIRSFRKPDPYKLKGVRYVGERLIKKERKAGVTTGA
jgi:large subunit ribosomal protein L6